MTLQDNVFCYFYSTASKSISLTATVITGSYKFGLLLPRLLLLTAILKIKCLQALSVSKCNISLSLSLSLSLRAVSILCTVYLERVQVFVTQNKDYLMFGSSLKKSRDGFNTDIASSFNFCKITGKQMLHRLLRNCIMENHIKLVRNNY